MSEQATLSPVRSETAAPPTAVPVDPSRAGAVRDVVVLLLGAAVALLAGLLIRVGPGGSLREVFIGGDGTAGAKAGDCVSRLPRIAGTEARPADDARTVRCSAADAAYLVVGRVQDATEARDRSAIECEPYFRPGDDGYVLYRVGEGGDGYLLCLVRRSNGR